MVLLARPPAPGTVVRVRIFSPLRSPTQEELDAYSLTLDSPDLVSPDDRSDNGDSITLSFTDANWDLPQTVEVRAFDDNAIEGTRTAVINHTVEVVDAGNAARYGG